MKKKLAILMASVMAVSVVAAGCGGGSSTTASTGAASGSEDAQESSGEAAEGGQALSVQVGPSPETIDPALNSAVDGANMIIHAFEGLLRMDKDNNIEPALAESYDVSDDGLTWTFHLREGLKWSDGSDLTANDFVYSWKRLVDPNTAAPYGSIINVVKGFEEAAAGDVDALAVSAPDDSTFVVELNNPCIYFDKLAAFAACVPVQQATIDANGESWTIEPETYVTDGAYYMTEFTDGDKIVFTKNPYYWDAENVTFETITWNLIEDANAAYTAFQNGDVQMIKSVPTEEIEALRSNEEFHVDPNLGTYYISFNTQREPFNDSRVREALSLAIDRDYVANTIMQGTYSPAFNFVGPGISDSEAGSSFADNTISEYGKHFGESSYEDDLAKAKELLAEAGYPNGEGFPEISYMTNDQGYHKSVAEYLQQAWAELGVNCTIDIQEWKTVTADRRAGNFDVARNGWVLDYDDPSNILELFESTNGNNDGKYDSAEYDQLVKEARETADKDEHYQKLHEAEQLMLNDAACAPVAYYNDFYLQSSKLTGTWHSPYGYWYFMYGTLAE
ncbi:MAG: ABC transporter substrate-binding protein [Eubacteriales bacterium]|nr:ABC transporter substrate-binding protein [Eubacteriales bacterium]